MTIPTSIGEVVLVMLVDLSAGGHVIIHCESLLAAVLVVDYVPVVSIRWPRTRCSQRPSPSPRRHSGIPRIKRRRGSRPYMCAELTAMAIPFVAPHYMNVSLHMYSVEAGAAINQSQHIFFNPPQIQYHKP